MVGIHKSTKVINYSYEKPTLNHGTHFCKIASCTQNFERYIA